MEPKHSWKQGTPRVTPVGTPLPGVYRDSYWCASFKNEDKKSITDLVNFVVQLLPARSKFWSQLHESGGNAMLIISVVGTKYQGAEISAETIAKLAEMRIALGIEVYAVPQSG